MGVLEASINPASVPISLDSVFLCCQGPSTIISVLSEFSSRKPHVASLVNWFHLALLINIIGHHLHNREINEVFSQNIYIKVNSIGPSTKPWN